MSQLQTIDHLPPRNGLAVSSFANHGAVAIEQERAVAEAQGKIFIAKRFPRDPNAVFEEVKLACQQHSLASVAFYSVPRGEGGSVTGPSIRLAEEIARAWGNLDWGHRELSRSEGKSEVEVYAWDMQTNTHSRRQITVMHVIDRRTGARPCKDQKEIDDLIANKASKQVRGRLLAILPKWLVEAAKDECRNTLASVNPDQLKNRVTAMIEAFSKFGVTKDQIAEYLGHPIVAITGDDLAELTGIYNSIREGTNPHEFFGKKDEPTVNTDDKNLNDALNSPSFVAKPSPSPGTGKPVQAEQKAKNRKEKADEPKADEHQAVEREPANQARESQPEPQPAPEPQATPSPAPADDDSDMF